MGGVGRRGTKGYEVGFRQARALGHQVNGPAECGEEGLNSHEPQTKSVSSDGQGLVCAGRDNCG